MHVILTDGHWVVSKRKNIIRHPLWLDLLEGGGVFIALPFLMFPTVKPVVTFLCLLLLVGIWILSTVVLRAPWPQTPFNGVMLVFFIMTAVGAGLSAFPDLTVSKATGLVIGFAMWRFLTYAITDYLRLRWAVIGFLVLCVGMTVVGVMATDWPAEVPILRKVFSLLPERLLDLPESASTKHSNQLGGTVLIYFPLVLSTLIASWYQRRRWIITAGISLSAVVVTLLLIATQSRSTWIGMLVSIFVLLLIWAYLISPSRKRIVLWVLAAGIVLIVVGGVLVIGPDRLLELLQEPTGMTAFGTLDTLAFRQEVWRWAVTAVSDFPFTGCGLGTFRRVVTLLYPLNVPMPDIAHAHNIFLQVALDIGIPGLIAYLALLGLMVWEAWQAAHDESYRVLAVGILGGTLALHVYGLLDVLALGSKPAVAFWYSLGLLSALARLRNNNA
jgi:putative inorganic carbon (HCO3(-)) transporter